METYFDSADSKKTGYLSLEMFDKWADNIRDLGKATAEEIQEVRVTIRDFFIAAGILPGKPATKKGFIEGMSRLAHYELEKKRLGEPTLHEKSSNAIYDAMGIKSDDVVTVDDVKVFMKCVDMDPEGAVQYFAMADKEKKGKLPRDDLIKLEFQFWFEPEDESTKGMYGGTYEGAAE
jgi:hypothetical protein